MSQSFDPDYDYKANKHYTTRSVGQLVTGPMKAVGYNNRVMRLTREDIDFEDADDARNFVDYHRLWILNIQQKNMINYSQLV